MGLSEPGQDAIEIEGPSLRSVSGGGLRQEICDILREAIWGGVLKPSQRLNEQWLAGEIGVSRPPLREAIRILEQEGLVEYFPRRGTFVKTLSGRDVVEIYTVRCALEGMAAELAMDRASPDELAALELQIDRVESQPATDLASIINADLEFHRALVEASANQRLVAHWEQIASQLRLALTLVDSAFFQPNYVESTHRRLVHAIREHDAPEAQRLTRTLLDVGNSLMERWEETPSLQGKASASR